jgi:hypothetical protein
MHIEAMNFGGMGTLRMLRPRALRIWRDRLDKTRDEMDWRSQLHPSARVRLRAAASCAM